MALNGSQVLLLVPDGEGYIPVAEQTGLSMESSSALIEVSHKQSNHTKFIYGREDDTLSLEAAYVPDDTAFKAIQNAKKNRETIILRRSMDGVEVEEAEALIENISIDFPDNDASTVSIDFQLNESWRTVA